MKKTLENFSSSAMETQSEALGRLSKKKFINDGGTIAAYLNKEENSAIRDHLTQAGFEPSQVTALAIVGVQRSPRYELLLESLNDADNKTNNGALSSIFTNLIDVYKFRGFIINKNSGG